MTKVAIIIPTMNRPDFILRQLRFYDLVNSPHPVYLSDSSSEENAEKLKQGLKEIKKFTVVYQWAPPGKDHLHALLPLVEESYCLQMGDDDLMIPKTISACADFLEEHLDYATCAGKQVDVRFRTEDYNKPYGLVDRQTRPLGRSIEHKDMLARLRDFWSDPPFICFAVRRIEIEKKIRNATKHFSLMERFLEVLLWSILAMAGKAKTIDELGYIMQISNNRCFSTELAVDFMLGPATKEKWDICQNGLSELLREGGISLEESQNVAKWIFILYLARNFTYETSWRSYGYAKPESIKPETSKKIRNFAAHLPLLKKMYYQFKPPQDVTRPESKYFNDFKMVKEFLESR